MKVRPMGLGQIKSALVIPTTTQLNRGDEALAWKAVETAKLCGFTRVAILTEDGFVEGQGDLINVPGSIGGYQPIAPFILSPRRGGVSEDRGFHDSFRNVFRLGCRALKDVLAMGWMIATAPWPGVCRLLLRSPQQRASLQYLAESNAVFVKGGGFVHAYRGARWLYYTVYQLFPIMLALRLRKKVVVLPNSYGPFHSKFSRVLVSSVFRRCEFVTARESVSARLMGDVLGTRIPVFPDMAFGLKPAPPEWAREELIAKGVPVSQKPCLGITVRPWRFPECIDPQSAYAQYIESMRHLVTVALKSGLHPVVFAHCLGPSHHEDDRIAVEQLVDSLGAAAHDVSVLGSPKYTAADLMALYGQMTAMVATRFHSVIFASVMGVPSIAVAYGGNKGVGIMSEMGLSDYVIPIEDVTPSRIETLFKHLTENLDWVRGKMREYVSESNKRLDAMIEMICARLLDEESS